MRKRKKVQILSREELMLRRWDFGLVPSERSLEAVGKSVDLHNIGRSMAFDLFPRTYRGKNRCVLRQKHVLINSRERARIWLHTRHQDEAIEPYWLWIWERSALRAYKKVSLPFAFSTGISEAAATVTKAITSTTERLRKNSIRFFIISILTNPAVFSREKTLIESLYSLLPSLTVLISPNTLSREVPSGYMT